MEYEIVPIEKLKPLEKVFPSHLENLTHMIIKDHAVTLPIYADKHTGIILDGSHRYAFFLGHGYDTVPVRWVDYDDENMRVGTHLAHRFEIDGDTNISKDEVRERGLSGNLYSPRTTRHFFPFRKEQGHISLDECARSLEERDIQHLLPDVSIDDEIKHNEGYLQELDQELETIKEYLQEAESTRAYLTSQIVAMKSGKEADATRDDLFSGI